MKTPIVLFVMVCLFPATRLAGQETYHHFPVHFGFFYPLGTQGARSTEFSYNFSLNVLSGHTGGVRGFETGGLFNLTKGRITGLQIAGLADVAGEGLSGMQVAGLANITGGGIIGIQVSGLASISGGNVSGMQMAGLFAKSDSLAGFQASGIFNTTGRSTGLQVAGIVNTSKQSVASISGIANLNSGKVSGIQIAGICNMTHTLKGVQIGLINLADSVEQGVSIGLVNLIRNRFFDEWSFDIADYQNLGISYRLGTRDLYTVYTVGMNLWKDKLWVTGLGLGHLEAISSTFSIMPEIICYTYLPMDFIRPLRDTWVYHFRVGLVKDLNTKLAVSVAPGVFFSTKSNRGHLEEYGYRQSPLDPVFNVKPAASNNTLGFGFGLSLSLVLK